MSLKETLEWFGGVLRAPMDENSRLIPSEETAKAPLYISASPTLDPESRIEIYAQQYWWRLYGILQEHFPLVARLFGYQGFNDLIATPYLVKNPPTHWNINLLGDDLHIYLSRHYLAPDAPLVIAAAELDSSFREIFLSKEAPLPSSEIEKLYLSPTTRLLSFKWNLPLFRSAVLKEEIDFWTDHDFPKLEKGDFYFLIRRLPRGDIALDQIEPEEFTLLKEFEKGVSLTDLCEKTPKNKETEAHLKTWIPKWIAEGLLTPQVLNQEKLH